MLEYFAREQHAYVGPFSYFSAPNGTCVIDSIIAMYSVWWLAIPSVAMDGYPTPFLYTYTSRMTTTETFNEYKLTFGVLQLTHRVWRKLDGSPLDTRTYEQFEAAK